MGRGGVTRAPTRAVTRPGPTLEGQTHTYAKKSPDPGHDPGRDPAGSGPDFSRFGIDGAWLVTRDGTRPVTRTGRGLALPGHLLCLVVLRLLGSAFGLLLLATSRASPRLRLQANVVFLSSLKSPTPNLFHFHLKTHKQGVESERRH